MASGAPWDGDSGAIGSRPLPNPGRRTRPCPRTHLELEELQHVRPRDVRELVVRVQGFAQALQGAEGAQHEGEGGWEAERLVNGDGEEVFSNRLRGARVSGWYWMQDEHLS